MAGLTLVFLNFDWLAELQISSFLFLADLMAIGNLFKFMLL